MQNALVPKSRVSFTWRWIDHIPDVEFQDVSIMPDVRAAVRGFIKYLLTYQQSQRKKGNPEP